MALDPMNPFGGTTIAPPGMLPDWSEEQERLYSESMGAWPAAPIDPMAAAPMPIEPAPLPTTEPIAPPMPVTDPAAAAPAPPETLAPPPLAVDAISGGDTIEHGATPEQAEDYAKIDLSKDHDRAVARQYGTPGDPLLPEEWRSQAELNQLRATQSAKDFGAAQFDYAQRQADFVRARQAEEDLKNAERAENDYVDFVRARDSARADMVQITAEANELANAKINPEKWWADRSTGQKISAFIAAIAGGLAAPYNGGRNDGLAMINQAIERDIAAQKDNLSQRRMAIAEKRYGVNQRLEGINNDYRDTERFRIAAYQRVRNQIATEAQNYDKRSATALQFGQLMRELDAKGAAAAEAYRQQKLKNDLEISKEERERAKVIEDARHNKAAERNVAYGIASENKRAKERLGFDKDKLAYDKEHDKETLNLAREKLKAEGDEKTAKLILEQGVAAPPQIKVNDDGTTTELSGDVLRLKNGKPWIINTVDEAKKFRAKKEAAEGLISILDEIQAIRDEVGGETSWGNSKAFQRLEVLRENAALIRKAGTEGMSSDADVERLIKAIGAKDPASFRDQTERLITAREQTEKQLNTAARNYNYDGPPIRYANPNAHKAAKTPEQAEIEGIIKFDRGRSIPYKQLADELGVDLGDRINNPKTAIDEALEKHGGVLPSMKRRIDALRAAQNDPDPKKRETAVEGLARIAADAEDPNVRAYATSNAFDMPAPTESATGGRLE